MKKLSFILCLIPFLGITVDEKVNAKGMTIIFNGDNINLSSPIIVENESILVPSHDIFEAFNAKVEWVDGNKKIKATKDNQMLWVIMDSYVGFIDGNVVKLQTPARMKQNVKYVPLKFVSNAFNLTVDWNKQSNTIFIKKIEDGITKEFVPDKKNTSKVIKAVAGRFFSMALREDGTVTAWGSNYNGVFGDGTKKNRMYIDSVGNVRDWKDVAAGAYSVALIKEDGTLWTLGMNDVGQLGDGSFNDRATLKQIGTSNDWDRVYSKSWHVAAIKKDGSLWMWGMNSAGQLGDGTLTNRSTPVKVEGNDWEYVAPGFAQTLAIKKDGTLWAWGHNRSGQLGLGDLNRRTRPTQVGTGQNWKDVSVDISMALAIKEDGTLWAWGDNRSGHIGNGKAEFKKLYKSPVQVGNESDWETVSTGQSSVFATKEDGSLWAWGKGRLGNVSDGTYFSKMSYVPIQIGQDQTWTSASEVGAEGKHTLALTADGEIYGWGMNTMAHAINGTFIEPQVPTKVNQAGSLKFTKEESHEQEYKAFPAKSDISKNKQWTITFNNPIQKKYINQQYIFYMDGKGEKIPPENVFSHSKKQVKVSPVEGGFNSGKDYTLVISHKIKGVNSNEITNGVKIDFTIKP
ncbi:RCC1 domain-containing protein [Pontibacillus marinus]|uniref:Copper amine oxidase-like N-terminal domain-containing protein n=1 Tax=Pontibacillus marinus BH030004 = DSM 16465 TaxID=1385511 RepID=A0A0A5HSN7_9BACI|nr:stalk domain-containing protein [Pontibacillus marinus]KGX86657.1 hypothetical protein N783_11815 [Pontibacillus marinus BH030004 = DSM 16465]